MLLVFWVCLSELFLRTHSQKCLESPPAIVHDKTRSQDIEWEAVGNKPNTWQHTITFDAATKWWYNEGGLNESWLNAKITTRLFDGHFPSQTIRFKRGNQYRITLRNNLGPEADDNPTEMNVWKDPNTTNIHTHGLHLGGMGNSDNVFVTIGPGESFKYRYNIPCSHSGGTFWWHPHHHGATHLQVAGGAAGALIIEDDANAEGMPDWYTSMDELIFFITHIHLSKYTSMLPDFDDVWHYEEHDSNMRAGDQEVWFVNGEFQPTVCQAAGQWTKFRFAQVETTEKARIFYIGHGECTLYLLARDGVMVHGKDNNDMPRKVGHGVFLAHSSRADVAISCPGNAEGRAVYPIYVGDDNEPQSNVTIAYIVVSGTDTRPRTKLTRFVPTRPNYLQNLLHYDGALERQNYTYSLGEYDSQLDYWKDFQVSGNTLENQVFGGEENYFHTLQVNKVHVWEITTAGNNLHPLHIHVNHFQIINSTLGDHYLDYPNWIDIPAGYQEEGDWLDTIWGPGYITFVTDLFAGSVAIHCHILIHEDQGAMGTILIENGCDGDYNDVGGEGVCDYVDTCLQFATDAPTAPTMPQPSPQPTPMPSLSPSRMPSLSPTRSPVSQPSTITLKLMLKGSLVDWVAEAMVRDATDTDGFALSKKCIEYAMNVADYPDLSAITINVEIVRVARGSIEITYSLTAWDRTFLELATLNLEVRVTARNKFDTGGAAFLVTGHEVLSEHYFVEPTNHPTAVPTAPTRPRPTTRPTLPPTLPDYQTVITSKLVLKGSLSAWLADATALDASDTEGFALSKQCIEYAMNVGEFPELSSITIGVQIVARGSVEITYTLTAWDPTLLDLASANIMARVGDRFEIGGKAYVMEGHEVLSVGEHYVVEPTEPATAVPAPTRSPVDYQTVLTLKLVLKGSLSDWLDEAKALNADDTDGFALSKECVEYAIKLDDYAELSAVTIDVQIVARGSVEITYTLTAWDRTLLDLASANIMMRVDDRDRFEVDGKLYSLTGHEVLSEHYFVEPTAPLTAVPTAPTRPQRPTLPPSSSSSSQSVITLKLVLKGSLSRWLSEAKALDATDTDGFALSTQCVEFAMNVGEFPELSSVTIDVQIVARGSVEITYTLTAWDRTLLDVASANIMARVGKGDRFDTGYAMYPLIAHEVLEEVHFVESDQMAAGSVQNKHILGGAGSNLDNADGDQFWSSSTFSQHKGALLLLLLLTATLMAMLAYVGCSGSRKSCPFKDGYAKVYLSDTQSVANDEEDEELR